MTDSTETIKPTPGLGCIANWAGKRHEPVEVLDNLYSRGLRESADRNGFIEGRYRWHFWKHDTGMHLDIYAQGDGDGDELQVYQRTYWFSGQYEFNNKGKVQGFIHDGPWVEEIIAHLKDFMDEIEEFDNRRAAREREDKDRAEREANEKVERFRSMFDADDLCRKAVQS